MKKKIRGLSKIQAFARTLADVRGRFGRHAILVAALPHWTTLGKDLDSIDGHLGNLLQHLRDQTDRLARAEILADLATRYLAAVCDKAEAGATCPLCGEDFTNHTVRELPDCPVPRARDFLTNPEGAVEAVLRASGELGR